MTTATATATEARREVQAPGLGRLTAVELRKMTDTRAGFWLLVVIGLLTVAIVAVNTIFGKDTDHTFRMMLSAALAPSSVLLPIVGILLVSSEWTQRTAQITFTLVPKRLRVIAAKLLAGVVLTLVTVVVGVVVAAIGTAASGPTLDLAWSMPVGFLFQCIVSVVTGMVMGIAFGAVLLASAPAIVAYFALPLAWGALGMISALQGPAEWLDQSESLVPLTEHIMSAEEWAKAATTLVLWMLLPLAIGTWRILRSEVR